MEGRWDYAAPVYCFYWEGQDKSCFRHARLGAEIIVIENRGAEADRFVSVSVSAEIAGRAELHEMAVQDGVMRMRPLPSGVEVDLSFASLPFELEALAAAEPLRIADVTLQVARPEDLIIYKAIAFRPQDQQDIERLVTLYASTLDMARIRETVRKLAAALDEPERLGALDLIVQRVGGLPPQGH